MKIDNHSARRLSLACLLLLAACKKVEPEESGSGNECQGDVCASNAPPIDWSAKNPTYSAHVQVVDTAGEPVKDATVKIAGKSVKTDKDGRAVVGPLDAVEVATVSVEKEGATPQITKATALSSARTTQEVTVAPLEVDKMVDVQKQTTAEVDGAHIEVPARALATEDGTRAKMARMQLTYFSGSLPAELLPGDSEAVNEKGAPTAMGPLGGVLYVRFDDDAKQPLNLAPGQIAMLELPVEQSFRGKDGQVIPMWTLDEESGQWKKESSCTISSRTVNGQAQQLCTGPVDHFSYWSYAREVDIYKPGAVGCMNATAKPEKDACFDFGIVSFTSWRCNAQGEACELIQFSRQQFIQFEPDIAWCGVLPADNATYRISLIYHADPTKCEGKAGELAKGYRSKVSEPLDLASFKEMLGSEVMLNFTLNGDRDCPTLCAQVPLTVTLKDLETAPWTDRDSDGAFAKTDDNVKPPFKLDCNDGDWNVRPYNLEPFCVNEDRNCDGRKTYQPYEKYSDVPYWRWNRECAACKWMEGVELPLTDEVKGNLYDENCDGYIDDTDLDGENSPADCNDLDNRVSSKKKEVPGNYLDENCDGIYLDADNDGEYNPNHVHLSEALGLGVDKFHDCDDFDPRVSPKTLATEEVGSLAVFYYQSGEDVRRAFYYCSLFHQDGSPNGFYYGMVRDLNCDGFVTDADGDGYTVRLDPALGDGRDTDCDDNDPRIHPVSDSDPTCMAPAGLINDTVCNIPQRSGAEGCPILTMAGTDVVTRCEETKDQDGNPTGLGACSYDGWWESNPLVINPGTAWGPCDGDVGLASCPQGNSCGGELPYTEPFTKYIEDTYLMSKPIEFKGMCFPSCDITK